MRRIKLTVAYDGCNYSGWQIQPNASTIEQVLDNAINKVTGEKVHVIGASRTDAGVHGLGCALFLKMRNGETSHSKMCYSACNY